jgi:ParB family chromosome partitioning protein
METIQAIIRNCTDEESIVLALIENLQRQDLNPIDAAKAYHRMMNEFGLTQDIIAQRVGCERSSIANTVRLLNLPVEVQHLVESGELSTGHAKVILGLTDSDSQLRFAQLVVSRGLSVRELEKLIQFSTLGRKRTRLEPRRSPWAEVEERLRKRLGTKVTILRGRRGGKVIIHYFSPPELDGILETLLS